MCGQHYADIRVKGCRLHSSLPLQSNGKQAVLTVLGSSYILLLILMGSGLP